MLIQLFLHCYTLACFSPQVAFLRDYWNNSWRLCILFYVPCSRNVSVLPENSALRAETYGGVTLWRKLVLTYIDVLVGFLRKIVTAVRGYKQDKIKIFRIEFHPDQSRNTGSKGRKIIFPVNTKSSQWAEYHENHNFSNFMKISCNEFHENPKHILVAGSVSWTGLHIMRSLYLVKSHTLFVTVI
jgi:hypothetical protein